MKPNAPSLAWKGLILGSGACLHATVRGRGAGGVYVGRESSRICREKVPYTPPPLVDPNGDFNPRGGAP